MYFWEKPNSNLSFVTWFSSFDILVLKLMEPFYFLYVSLCTKFHPNQSIFARAALSDRGATLSLRTMGSSVGSFLAFWRRCWTMNNVEGSMEKRYNGLGMTKPRHWPPKSGGGGNPAAAGRWRWMGVEHRVRWVASEYKRKWFNHRSNGICVTFWKYWIRNPII